MPQPPAKHLKKLREEPGAEREVTRRGKFSEPMGLIRKGEQKDLDLKDKLRKAKGKLKEIKETNGLSERFKKD